MDEITAQEINEHRNFYGELISLLHVKEVPEKKGVLALEFRAGVLDT